jgi:predicted dehydrogenase
LAVVNEKGEVLRQVESEIHDYVSVAGKLRNGGVGTVVYQCLRSNTGKAFYWEISGTKGSLVLRAEWEYSGDGADAEVCTAGGGGCVEGDLSWKMRLCRRTM